MGATSELYIKLQDELINTVNQVEEGELSCLDALIELERSRKYLESSLAIIKGFKDTQLNNISNEASEYRDGYRGFMIEVRNGGKMYNYKHIPEWSEADTAKKEIESKYKTMFEAKVKGLEFANVDENGEELPMPVLTYRKSSVVLKEKKS